MTAPDNTATKAFYTAESYVIIPVSHDSHRYFAVQAGQTCPNNKHPVDQEQPETINAADRWRAEGNT